MDLPRGLNTMADHMVDTAAPMRAQLLLQDQPKERIADNRHLGQLTLGQKPTTEMSTQYSQKLPKTEINETSRAFAVRPGTNTTGRFQGPNLPQRTFWGENTRRSVLLK